MKKPSNKTYFLTEVIKQAARQIRLFSEDPKLMLKIADWLDESIAIWEKEK